MSFKDIQEKIAADIAAKEAPLDAEGKQAIPVPAKVKVQPVDAKGMPQPEVGQDIGTVLSMPGTEQVQLDASTFQLMKCTADVRGREKVRYCIVEKGVSAKYGNQFVNSEYNLTHIVTRQVFHLLHGVFAAVDKKIKQLDTELRMVTQQRDLQQTTLDALKKAGII